MRINPAIFEATIGEEIVLLNEDTGQLVLLDTVASVFWHGLNSGLMAKEIALLVANQSGADEKTIQRDVTELMDRWASQGFLQSGDLCKDRANPGPVDEVPNTGVTHSSNHRTPTSRFDHLVRLGTFGVGDVIFEVYSSAPEVKQATDKVFGHSRVDSCNERHFALTVEREPDGWTLFCNGKYEAHCRDERELAPMLHANTLLLIYQHSNAEIALHAASVTINNECIMLPGKSGSGKSTLSAALMSEGYRFCSDDLVLLAGPDLAVIPVTLCIGLKEGAWENVAARYPAVAQLATHIRADGKAIRYLPPLPKSQVAGRGERLPTTLLIFPTYESNCRNEFRYLSPAQALVRLTESGYDVSSRLDRVLLRRLISWIEDIPCIELRYNIIDYAIDSIASLRSGDIDS